ncbi:MAG TPA: hypothetical protein DCZ12_04865 [Gammaproteobacteria bacterium]|nr:hypothetical protein [Gammaproteobacteria bacterium]
MQPPFRIILLLIIVLLSHQPAIADLRVSVTIKPLQAIVTALMDGLPPPTQLVRDGESPHHAQLRPSTLSQLSHSQLVVRVSPGLEGLLSKAINNLQDQVPVITFSQLNDVNILPARAISSHGNHTHETHSATTSLKDGQHHDPHLWLDTNNVRILAHEVGRKLSELDPTHEALYTRNKATFLSQLAKLDQSIQKKLAAAKTDHVRIILFHDAFQYFERRYGISIAGFVSATEAHAPGTRHLCELQKRVLGAETLCFLSEPQSQQRLADNLFSKHKHMIKGTIDPIGYQIPLGKNTYIELMEKIADAFYSCYLGK